MDFRLSLAKETELFDCRVSVIFDWTKLKTLLNLKFEKKITKVTD